MARVRRNVNKDKREAEEGIGEAKNNALEGLQRFREKHQQEMEKEGRRSRAKEVVEEHLDSLEKVARDPVLNGQVAELEGNVKVICRPTWSSPWLISKA